MSFTTLTECANHINIVEGVLEIQWGCYSDGYFKLVGKLYYPYICKGNVVVQIQCMPKGQSLHSSAGAWRSTQ